LNKELCLDSDNLYVSGASNGGMFVYYLSSQLPNLFKGWAVLYGLPLVGYLNSPKS